MSTTLRPNARGVNAYQRGHRAHGDGLHHHDNPWGYLICCDPLKDWWEAGWLDSYAGKPDRFEGQKG